MASFDYKPGEERLRELLNNFRSSARASLTANVEMGNALSEAKKCVGHGRYLLWVKLECGIKPRTAQNLVNLASLAKRHGEVVYTLPPTGGYRLADPSTPDEIVSQVFEAAKRGDKITVAWIEEVIRAAKVKTVETVTDEAAADMATKIILALRAPLTTELSQFLKNARPARKKAFLNWLETQAVSPQRQLSYLPAA